MKVWYITGVSQGIGLLLAKQVLDNGQKVAGTTRNPDCEELKKLKEQYNDLLLVLRTDLANEESVKHSVDETIQTFGRLDVVVNNAGYCLLGSLEEISDGELRKYMDINVFAMFNVIRYTIPYLRKQNSGHVINMSSIMGFYSAFPGNVAYSAAKFAIGGMSEALYKEMEPFGVKVTIVYPGRFRTNFFANSYQTPNNKIDEYQTRETELICLDSQGKQRGDTTKAVEIIYNLVNNDNKNIQCPLHLFLGPDANEMAQDKINLLQNDLNQWKSITDKTDFVDSN